MEVISAFVAASLGAPHIEKAHQAMLRLCGGYSACTVLAIIPLIYVTIVYFMDLSIILHIGRLSLLFGPPVRLLGPLVGLYQIAK